MSDTRRMDGRGRVTIPQHIIERLGVKAGDRIDFIVEDGIAVLVPVRRPDPTSGEDISTD